MQEYMEAFEAFAQSWWPYVISILVGIIGAIRIYVGGTPCGTVSRIDGKAVIITGGSSGIGLEVAKELAKRGGEIILAIRNAKKGVQAIEQIKRAEKRAKVTVKLLDVSEFASIRHFVEDIKSEYDKIDILINNAATISPPGHISEGKELTFVTNYFGPFLLTHLLLPLLDKAEQGRVINVSAMAHLKGKLSIDYMSGKIPLAEKDAFASSKLALTMFTKHMADLYSHTKITFNSVNPGLVRDTEHFEKYTKFSKSFLNLSSIWPWMWLFLKNPNQGCQSIVYLALEPTLHQVTGCYFSDCEIKEPSELVNDGNMARALYEKTCKIVNIKPEEILPLANEDEETTVEED